MRARHTALWVTLQVTALAPATLAPPLAAVAQSSLTPEEKKVIGERLAPVINFEKNVKIEAGGTLFVVLTLEVPSTRFRAGDLDYDAFTSKVDAPNGVLVPKHVDQYKLTRRGDKVEISFRYAITLEPRATKGGRVAFTLSLTERVGLGNEIANAAVVHQLTVVPPKPSAVDMAADFRGYRVYKALAAQGVQELTRAGLRGVTLSDNAPLPPLDRVDAATAERAFELDRWRRRMAIARRHLEAAAASSERATSATAQQYLALLDAPDDKLGGLPAVSLVGGGGGTATVETVEPEKPKTKSVEAGGILQPLENKPKAKADPDSFARTEAAKPVAKPVTPAPKDVNLAEQDGEELTFARKSKDEIVPTYPRGLVLDDPNIAFGAWVRFNFAQVADRRTALTPAWFFGVETMITRSLGFELTVPTVLVSVTDIEEAVPVFSMGNPLVAAKWRFHLPEIEGRRPVLTPRVRWGIPVNARNLIPRTSLGAEDFSYPANFVDTYAFTLEKTAVGGGVSAAYAANIFHVSAQLYVDYFFPVSKTNDRLSFTTLQYGLSFGARPWGDIVGFYLEGRGSALVAGPRRSELFTYLGVRGHFLEYLEPALWVSLPIGSVNRVSGFQFGMELRASYDIEGVISKGSGETREGSRLLEER